MTTMISLALPEEAPKIRSLHSPGGFAWWYLDHVDTRGNGFVLIWSLGLPFLPGYRAQPTLPVRRPSLNVVTYRDGTPDFYLLEELSPEAVSIDASGARFGRSTIRSRRSGGVRYTRIDLDCAIPGDSARFKGHLELSGAPTLLPRGGDGPHGWAPILGPAAVEGQLGGRRFSGLAYHDRNESRRPLHTLGIDHWTWGRAVRADRTLAYYILWPTGGDVPTAWVLELAQDGRTRFHENLRLETYRDARARFGMRHHPSMTLFDGNAELLTIDAEKTVDDGPFYLRQLARLDGELGFAEWLTPDRVDVGWQRPFVRMRVHAVGRRNSVWLPLFSGTAKDRLARLLRRRT